MASVEVCVIYAVRDSGDLPCVQSFESTLKEVVRAKRLSASKMKELTDIALKMMKVRIKASLV